eukprot:113640-Chlamydomonas_euryale.AAC.1
MTHQGAACSHEPPPPHGAARTKPPRDLIPPCPSPVLILELASMRASPHLASTLGRSLHRTAHTQAPLFSLSLPPRLPLLTHLACPDPTPSPSFSRPLTLG